MLDYKWDLDKNIMRDPERRRQLEKVRMPIIMEECGEELKSGITKLSKTERKKVVWSIILKCILRFMIYIAYAEGPWMILLFSLFVIGGYFDKVLFLIFLLGTFLPSTILYGLIKMPDFIDGIKAIYNTITSPELYVVPVMMIYGECPTVGNFGYAFIYNNYVELIKRRILLVCCYHFPLKNFMQKKIRLDRWDNSAENYNVIYLIMGKRGNTLEYIAPKPKALKVRMVGKVKDNKFYGVS